MKSLRDGEAKVKAAHALGEKTIPQTAPQGQSHIRRDLEALTQDFEALATRMGNTQENLIHALEALTAYDGSCDQLNKWLREMEATIKDVELRPTLGDKQGQVEKLKVIMLCMLSSFTCYCVFFRIFCHFFYSTRLFKIKTRGSNCLDSNRPNILLGLFWVQTFCEGYQQTTNTLLVLSPLAGEINHASFYLFIGAIKQCPL